MKTYRQATELMEAEVADELVALDPELGLCFGFNSVATDVWKQLKRPKRVDELHAHLRAAYDVDEERCSRELEELLDRMVELHLIRCDAD